jgi:hypothetical protein
MAVCRQSRSPHPGGLRIDHRARPGRSARPRRLPGRGGRQPGYGSFGRRAARRGRDPGAPARSQHGHHGLFRASAKARPARRISRLMRCGDGGQGLQHRPVHGRGRGAGLADAALMAARPRPGSGASRGISARTAPSKSPNPARRRPWNSIRGSTIPRARPSAPIKVCMCTAIPMASSGGYPTTSHTLSCVVLAGTGEDMQRDYWYSSSRDWRELESAEAIGRESARRTIARLDPRKLSTRRAPVLFVPEIARGFIGHFTAAIRGSSQYRQSSFLLNSVGQQVFPPDSRSRAAAHPQGHGQRAVRRGGRGDPGSRADRRRRAHRLHPVELLGAQARAQDHRQRRRRAQSLVAPTLGRLMRCCRASAPALGDRADGPGRQHGDRRLLARRRRLLGRER